MSDLNSPKAVAGDRLGPFAHIAYRRVLWFGPVNTQRKGREMIMGFFAPSSPPTLHSQLYSDPLPVSDSAREVPTLVMARTPEIRHALVRTRAGFHPCFCHCVLAGNDDSVMLVSEQTRGSGAHSLARPLIHPDKGAAPEAHM